MVIGGLRRRLLRRTRLMIGRSFLPLLYKYPLFPGSRSLVQKGPVPRPSRRRRRKRRSLGIMPKLQDYTVYIPDNQIADLAERQGMRVHLITGPTQHVLREAHTVYLFGSVTPLRDMDDTGRVTELVSSMGQDVLLCDVTSGQWYKRAPSDQTFTHLHASTFPVLHLIYAVPSWASGPCRPITCNSSRSSNAPKTR